VPLPAPPPARLSGSTSIPAAGQTTVTTPRTARGAQPVPDDAAEEGTVRVDRNHARATTDQQVGPEAGPAADERHEIRPGVLLGVVGALVAVLVVVTAWAVTRGGDTPSPGPSQSTVAGPPEDEPFDVPQVPEIVARGTTGGVAFSWTYSGVEKGDTYRFRWASELGQLEEAKFGPPLTTTNTVVKVAKGKQACGQARVIRGGQQTNWSEPQCERAG
jgi:hypothetical protein